MVNRRSRLSYFFLCVCIFSASSELSDLLIFLLTSVLATQVVFPLLGHTLYSEWQSKQNSWNVPSKPAEFALAQHSMTRHFQVVSTFTFLRGDRDGEFPPSPPPPLFSIHPIKIANCSKNQGKDEISHPHAGL